MMHAPITPKPSFARAVAGGIVRRIGWLLRGAPKHEHWPHALQGSGPGARWRRCFECGHMEVE